MQGTEPAGALQIYAHSANAAFAERIATALESRGFRIEGGAFDLQRIDGVIVLWSPASVQSAMIVEAARAPMEAGVLVPVSIGRLEPPAGFEKLPPANLGGWTGDVEDPRWRFVLEDVERAARAVRTARAVAAAEPAPRRAAGRGARFTPLLAHAPLAAAGGLAAALALAAVLAVTPNAEPAPRRAAIVEGAPPLLAYVAPLAPDEAGPGAAQEPEAAPIEIAAAAEGAGETGEPAEAEGDTDALEAPQADEVAETLALPSAPSVKPAQHDAIAALIVAAAPEAAAPAATPVAATAGAAYLGNFFKDCPACPDMAAIEAGAFTMGAPEGEIARAAAEGPTVEVRIAERFAIGTREVTFEQWNACVAAGGCAGYAPHDAGWGAGRKPVINVSFEDAQAYVRWLTETTGRRYRLPSEAEWEYAARAGTDAPFAFGGTVRASEANFDARHPYGGPAGEPRGRTLDVASLKHNAYGLFDMHGNVWEWTQDCWTDSHDGRPPTGAARTDGPCAARVLKGGAWNSGAWRLRSGHRIGKPATAREFDNGFRVAADLG